MRIYWDTGTNQFMVSEGLTDAGVTARPATHTEIKSLLDDVLKGWRDLLDGVGRALGERP